MRVASSLPKATEKPYRSMKGTVRQSQRPYTVKLLDDRARGANRPMFPDFWQELEVTQPTTSLGWCLPNNFEASIDGLLVTFRVDMIKKRNRGEWAIVSLEIKSEKETAAITSVNLPLQTFLTDAINLSTLRCMTYPPHYEGVSIAFRNDGWINNVLKVDEHGHSEVLGWADSTPAPILRDFTNTRTGRKPNSKERLKIVAKAHKSAKHGEKFKKVKEALELYEGVVGNETVRNLIKQAIAEGLTQAEPRSKK